MGDTGWDDDPPAPAAPQASATGWDAAPAANNSFGSSSGATNGWSGGGGGGGRGGSNSWGSTKPAVGSSWGASGGHANGAGGSSSYAPLTVSASLYVEKLPVTTEIANVRSIFGRYGRIKRVVLDYRVDEERAFCWIDYADEKSCDHAIRIENGRKMNNWNIVVQKGSGGAGDSGAQPPIGGGFSDSGGGRGRGRGGRGGDSWGTPKNDWSSKPDTATSWGATSPTPSSGSSTDRGSNNNNSWGSPSDGGRGGRGGGRGRGFGDRGRGRGRGGGDRYTPYNRSGSGSSWADKAEPSWGDETKSSASDITAPISWDVGGSSAPTANADTDEWGASKTTPSKPASGSVGLSWDDLPANSTPRVPKSESATDRGTGSNKRTSGGGAREGSDPWGSSSSAAPSSAPPPPPLADPLNDGWD